MSARKEELHIYDPEMEGLSNEMRSLGKDLTIVGEVGITGFNASKGVLGHQVCRCVLLVGEC